MIEARVQIQINGESREVPKETTISELVAQLSLAPERVAIERNREVVRRTDWSSTQLNEHDRIEIVHFVGGGCGRASIAVIIVY